MKSTQQHKTAILVFANSSALDAELKSIYKGEALFKGLTNHTLKQVKKMQLPYFCLTEKEQVGVTFSDRFVNAMQTVYNKGFSTIIVVGNDTPALRVRHLKEAKIQSEKGNLVVGPSTDGGFYLLALHKKLFSKLPFKNLAWQTPKLLGGLSLLAAFNTIKVISLQILADVDTNKDIKQFIDNGKLNATLLQLFLAVFVINLKQDVYYSNYYSTNNYRYFRNRGSPSIFLS